MPHKTKAPHTPTEKEVREHTILLKDLLLSKLGMENNEATLTILLDMLNLDLQTTLSIFVCVEKMKEELNTLRSYVLHATLQEKEITE